MLDDCFSYIERKGTDSIKWDPTMMRYMVSYVDDLSLPLWVADMDFRTVPAAVEQLKKRVEHGIYGYHFSDHHCYNAIQQWYKQQYHTNIQTNWITFTPSVLSALAFLIQSFTKEGDGIIIQEPVYYPFRNTIQQNKRQVINNALIEKDGYYSIDFDDLEKKLKDITTTMMIFCSPHNPVARVWTEEELLKVVNLCYENNVILCSDEIHGDLIFGDTPFISATSFSEAHLKNSIILSSSSKTFNTAGLATAHVIISDDTKREQFQSFMSMLNIRNVPSLFLNSMIPILYSDKGKEWLEQLLIVLRENLLYMEEFLTSNLPTVKFQYHQGTFLVWLDFRDTGLDWQEIERKMEEEAKCVLDPGSKFGEKGRGFMRINIACHQSILEESLQRIQQVFK